MNNKLLIIAIILLCNVEAITQAELVKGYIIEESGNRKEGLIQNIKWFSNPETVNFMEIGTSVIKEYQLNTIKEFAITEGVKYKSAYVEYDISDHDIYKLTTSKAPQFISKQVLLKVLTEGDVSLYEYRDASLLRFFVGYKDKVEQLIYKPFLVQGGVMSYNRQYRQQLKNILVCDNISDDYLLKIEYEKEDLVNILNAYYQCTSQSLVFNDQTKYNGEFSLSVLASASLRSLELENFTSNLQNVTFDSKMVFGFGIQGDYVLPFQKNKWSITSEVAYKKYTNQHSFNYNNIIPNDTLKVDYKLLEIPVGLRHYFNLSDNIQLFVNPSIGFNFNLNSKHTYANGPELQLSPGVNFTVAFGLKLFQKLSIDIRYHIPHDLLSSSLKWISEYKGISLTTSYTLFSK